MMVFSICLDGNRRLVDTQNARGLARRRADPSGELRKIVSGMQDTDRFLPAIAVNEIVPVRDDVAERAAGVAEGDAAVHAARRLDAELAFRKLLVNLKVVVDALRDGTSRRHLARVLLESGYLTHGAPHEPEARWSAKEQRFREDGECRARACIRAGTL